MGNFGIFHALATQSLNLSNLASLLHSFEPQNAHLGPSMAMGGEFGILQGFLSRLSRGDYFYEFFAQFGQLGGQRRPKGARVWSFWSKETCPTLGKEILHPICHIKGLRCQESANLREILIPNLTPARGGGQLSDTNLPPIPM